MIICAAGLERWTGAASSLQPQLTSTSRRWSLSCSQIFVFSHNSFLSINQSDQVDWYQDHLMVSTKADTLTSKPQQPNLPFVSASELRRSSNDSFLTWFLLGSEHLTSGVDSSWALRSQARPIFNLPTSSASPFLSLWPHWWICGA